MKAALIITHGGVKGLEIREVAAPESPAADRVRVRVHAAALNRADILQRLGRYPAPPGFPKDIPGMEFAGGFLIHEPKGDVISTNITPSASGIAYYNDATFIQALRQGKVGARPLHASMPWYFFGRMTDNDLEAIFAYLKTIKPVKHQIDNFERPTFCRLCKQKHGFGATN